MTEPVRVTPDWLALREPADAAARAADLAERVRRLTSGRRVVVHDLGSGTGSMGRWLAPRLTGPQHWVLHDRDPDLLVVAAAELPRAASDGTAVTVETRQGDITRLAPADLSGADLVTASALLDMLDADELERLVTSCVDAGCPALVTLSVVGRVDLQPADPLDETVTKAFNAHQRRRVDGRALLGPDAAAVAVHGFTRRGWDVVRRESPWCLDTAHAGQAALVGQWLAGWVGAACEQQPELAAPVAAYTRRRLAAGASGQLRVTVHHEDLLALPR